MKKIPLSHMLSTAAIALKTIYYTTTQKTSRQLAFQPLKKNGDIYIYIYNETYIYCTMRVGYLKNGSKRNVEENMIRCEKIVKLSFKFLESCFFQA